jgi:hypothetical protein
LKGTSITLVDSEVGRVCVIRPPFCVGRGYLCWFLGRRPIPAMELDSWIASLTQIRGCYRPLSTDNPADRLEQLHRRLEELHSQEAKVAEEIEWIQLKGQMKLPETSRNQCSS